MYVLFCPRWKQVTITIPHKILPYFNYFDAAMKSSPVTPKDYENFPHKWHPVEGFLLT